MVSPIFCAAGGAAVGDEMAGLAAEFGGLAAGRMLAAEGEDGDGREGAGLCLGGHGAGWIAQLQ